MATHSGRPSTIPTYTTTINKAMAKIKTATLNLRVDPLVKEALRDAAERQHRSIANMVEMLIREHCKAEGFPVKVQSNLFGDENGQ